MPEPTAREILASQLEHRANAAALLDAYRDEVLTEAAALISSTSLARLEAIDEDEQRPTDWERHQEWCTAAVLLLAAR